MVGTMDNNRRRVAFAGSITVLLPGRDDRPKLPKVRGLNGEDLYGEWIKSKDKGQP